MDIINSDEICIITVMPKDKKEVTLMESFKLDYIYDYEYDLVDLTIKNDFKYLKSIFLVSPDIDMLIDVNDDLIKIEIKFTFLVNKIERDVSFKQNIANSYGIPSIETLLSTV